jgi:Tol biopolymer transport system component
MKNYLCSMMAVCSLLFFSFGLSAQNNNKEAKPYKLFSSGNQLRISSTQTLKEVMIWTTDGHRVVEQKRINNNTVTISIPINRNYFFVMIGLVNGKIYTEKLAF